MNSLPSSRLSPDATPTLPWILFRFNGRLPRRAFWLYGVLALIGMSLLLTVLLRVAGASARGAEVAVNLLLLWPWLAVSVKRWHDRDKSGWWVLIALVPLVGWIWILVENGFLRGTPGANRFGENQAGRF